MGETAAPRQLTRNKCLNFAPAAKSIASMTGSWGFEIIDGLRYYRFRLTVKKDQDLF